MLRWKVHRAVIRAKLEPYLGFLHSVQFGKPSLVCDLQELYRHLVDNFVIEFCQGLRKKDFVTKSESVDRSTQTVETLINEEALLLAKFLRDERKTWIPRIVLDH